MYKILLLGRMKEQCTNFVLLFPKVLIIFKQYKSKLIKEEMKIVNFHLKIANYFSNRLKSMNITIN